MRYFDVFFSLQLITIKVSCEGVLLARCLADEMMHSGSASFLKEFIYKSSVRAEQPHRRCRRGPSSW